MTILQILNVELKISFLKVRRVPLSFTAGPVRGAKGWCGGAGGRGVCSRYGRRKVGGPSLAGAGVAAARGQQRSSLAPVSRTLAPSSQSLAPVSQSVAPSLQSLVQFQSLWRPFTVFGALFIVFGPLIARCRTTISSPVLNALRTISSRLLRAAFALPWLVGASGITRKEAPALA